MRLFIVFTASSISRPVIGPRCSAHGHFFVSAHGGAKSAGLNAFCRLPRFAFAIVACSWANR